MGLAQDFRPKDGSDGDGDGSDFRGQKRRNDTHASTTDPDARLMRKGRGDVGGKEAKLSYGKRRAPGVREMASGAWTLSWRQRIATAAALKGAF
ncbi:MAG: hypothetical protein BGO50_06895 [Rhodanobacter sp. 67-28]|nr:MAG: hypothetical protein BGO50_06895 [Rhodanobacter sp. 67-28]